MSYGTARTSAQVVRVEGRSLLAAAVIIGKCGRLPRGAWASRRRLRYPNHAARMSNGIETRTRSRMSAVLKLIHDDVPEYACCQLSCRSGPNQTTVPVPTILSRNPSHPGRRSGTADAFPTGVRIASASRQSGGNRRKQQQSIPPRNHERLRGRQVQVRALQGRVRHISSAASRERDGQSSPASDYHDRWSYSEVMVPDCRVGARAHRREDEPESAGLRSSARARIVVARGWSGSPGR